MKLTLNRKTFSDVATLGELSVDASLMGYTIEPPTSGDGMTAIPEGEYSVSLSHNADLNSLMPYVIGVPLVGAAMIDWMPNVSDNPEESAIRLVSSLDLIDLEPNLDVRLFTELMLRLRVARAEGITIIICSETNASSSIQQNEDGSFSGILTQEEVDQITNGDEDEFEEEDSGFLIDMAEHEVNIYNEAQEQIKSQGDTANA